MRAVDNWITAFEDLTNGTPSPALFRTWSAISAIAATLERRVWVDAGYGSNLYPNLYTFLIAPPGVGKTVLTSLVKEFWHDVADGTDKLFVASSSVTSASLVDEMNKAVRKIQAGPMVKPMTYNALAVCANELGVLLPVYDDSMMNKLTDIYDCKDYSESRRGKDLYIGMNNPQINILAATTPAQIARILPEGAWDQGFLSRTLLVFSGAQTVQPLWQAQSDNTKLKEKMKKDLNAMFKLTGAIIFSPEAAEEINQWHLGGGQPRPNHPRLHNYNTRRTAHLLKLCMVATIATGDSLIVETEHLATAMGWLLSIEKAMPDIFKAMIVNSDTKAMEECQHFAIEAYMREKQSPVQEYRLIRFLSERVPAYNVARILEVMVNAGLLKETHEAKVGKCYTPVTKRH